MKTEVMSSDEATNLFNQGCAWLDIYEQNSSTVTPMEPMTVGALLKTACDNILKAIREEIASLPNTDQMRLVQLVQEFHQIKGCVLHVKKTCSKIPLESLQGANAPDETEDITSYGAYNLMYRANDWIHNYKFHNGKECTCRGPASPGKPMHPEQVIKKLESWCYIITMKIGTIMYGFSEQVQNNVLDLTLRYDEFNRLYNMLHHRNIQTTFPEGIKALMEK